MFKKNNYILLCGLVLALSITGTCNAEKLEIVVAQAVASNPIILGQKANRLVQDSKLRESLGGFLPKIDFAAAYGRDHNKNYFTRLESNTGELTLTRREAGISIKQMLFDGYAVRAEVEANTALVQSSSYLVSARLEDVILQVTAAYIETIMQRSIFIHAKDSVNNHQNIIDQLKNGSIKNAQPGDMELAKSRLSLAQTVLLDLQSDIRISQADYIKVVGTKPGVMFRPEQPQRTIPINEEAAVALALTNNPLVSLGDAEIRAARAEKRGAKAGYFPKIDLELAGTNNKNVDGINQKTNSLSAMLQMKYNIFRGGKDLAAERRSAWQLEAKKESQNEALRIIEQNVRRSWSDFVNYKGQLVYLKQRVDTLSDTKDAYYKQVSNGERRILDLLDAEQELYAAKANFVAVQYKELLSRFFILHGIGKIKEHFNVQAPIIAANKSSNWLNGF